MSGARSYLHCPTRLYGVHRDTFKLLFSNNSTRRNGGLKHNSRQENGKFPFVLNITPLIRQVNRDIPQRF